MLLVLYVLMAVPVIMTIIIVNTEDDNETTTIFSKLHSDSPDAPLNTDPARWINFSIWQWKTIVLDGPPSNPTTFTDDSSGHPLAVIIFRKTLQNGESVLKNRIDLQNCRWQGCDNRSIMSGIYNGV